MPGGREADRKFSLNTFSGCVLLPLKLSLIILDLDFARRGCGPSLLGGLEEESGGMARSAWVFPHIYFLESHLMVLFVQVPGRRGPSEPAELCVDLHVDLPYHRAFN